MLADVVALRVAHRSANASAGLRAHAPADEGTERGAHFTTESRALEEPDPRTVAAPDDSF